MRLVAQSQKLLLDISAKISSLSGNGFISDLYLTKLDLLLSHKNFRLKCYFRMLTSFLNFALVSTWQVIWRLLSLHYTDLAAFNGQLYIISVSELEINIIVSFCEMFWWPVLKYTILWSIIYFLYHYFPTWDYWSFYFWTF